MNDKEITAAVMETAVIPNCRLMAQGIEVLQKLNDIYDELLDESEARIITENEPITIIVDEAEIITLDDADQLSNFVSMMLLPPYEEKK